MRKKNKIKEVFINIIEALMVFAEIYARLLISAFLLFVTGIVIERFCAECKPENLQYVGIVLIIWVAIPLIRFFIEESKEGQNEKNNNINFTFSSRTNRMYKPR